MKKMQQYESTFKTVSELKMILENFPDDMTICSCCGDTEGSRVKLLEDFYTDEKFLWVGYLE
jgi:hypothetical protein